MIRNAIASKNREVFQFMFEEFSTVHTDAYHFVGYCTVVCALETGSIETIERLQQHGGNLNNDILAKDAMYYAIKGVNQSVVSYLLGKGFKIPTDALHPLWPVPDLDDISDDFPEASPEFVQLLLDKGAAPDVEDMNGDLFSAASCHTM